MNTGLLHPYKRPIPASRRNRYQRQIARHHPALLHTQRVFQHIPCVLLLQSLLSGKVFDREKSFATGSDESIAERMSNNPHIHPQINLHTRIDCIRMPLLLAADHHVYPQKAGIISAARPFRTDSRRRWNASKGT